MAALTATTIVEAGVDLPSFDTCAAGGDTVPNSNGDMFLHIKNGSGGAITVTVTAQRTSVTSPGMGATTKADAVEVVGATSESYMGPFAPLAFNDANNLVAVTYSGVTSLTMRAFRLPRVD